MAYQAHDGQVSNRYAVNAALNQLADEGKYPIPAFFGLFKVAEAGSIDEVAK
jgi:hypothetical protein